MAEEGEEERDWESHERLTALLAALWYLVVRRWVWRGTKEQTRANVDIAGVWVDVNRNEREESRENGSCCVQGQRG